MVALLLLLLLLLEFDVVGVAWGCIGRMERGLWLLAREEMGFRGVCGVVVLLCERVGLTAGMFLLCVSRDLKRCLEAAEMTTLRQPQSIQTVTKFYSGSWFKGTKAITEILHIPLTGHETIAFDWSIGPAPVIRALVDNLKSIGDNKTVKTLRLLNKHWRTTISNQATSMKPAVLEKEDFPHFQKAMTQQFVNIRKLELPAAWMEDYYCARIASFRNCAELDFFWFDNVTDDGLKHIASLPNLSSLKIYHCRQITDKGLKALAKSTVKELWLYGGVQVSDSGLGYLSGCQSLKQLRLMYCNSITKKGLEAFVNRPDMKLTVRFCRRIPCDIHIT